MNVAVVGAGVAGLTSAAYLSQKGFHVDVYDNSPQVGGKMYQYTNEEGLSWDTGPTLISLPNEIRNTFKELQYPCPELIPLTENCELVFNDGTHWKIPLGIDNIFNYFNKLDSQMAKELNEILRISKSIFDFAESGLFHSPPPSFLTMGLKSFQSGFIFKNSNIAFTPYVKVIDKLIQNNHMREFFYHFASYIGELPDVAQGGILSIAHVELESEVVFPKGGVYNIAQSLSNVCLKNNTQFHLNTSIASAVYEKENAKWNLQFKKDEQILSKKYDLIISNCDPYVASQTWLNLPYLEKEFSSKIKKNISIASESQFVILFDWEDSTEIGHHVKIFPQSWKSSFEKVYTEKLIPEDPCVYLVWPHATDKSISPRILFISAMAPNTNSDYIWDEKFSLQYAEKVLHICRTKLNLPLKGKIFKMVSPLELETRTQSLKGGIYSAAPTKFNAMNFRFSGVPPINNLYFVGAGVHPGAGVTMVMKSARRIVQHILKKYPSKVN